MHHLRSGKLSPARAAVLLVLLILSNSPVMAQFEPPVKTDWRFVIGGHWVGLVEYSGYNAGKTYIQLPNGRRHLSPTGIELTAVLVFVIPIFGIILTIFGIRSAFQFFKKEKILKE